jgi:hypothetical protein
VLSYIPESSSKHQQFILRQEKRLDIWQLCIESVTYCT